MHALVSVFLAYVLTSHLPGSQIWLAATAVRVLTDCGYLTQIRLARSALAVGLGIVRAFQGPENQDGLEE